MLRFMIKVLGLHGKLYNQKEQQDLITMQIEGV
jgi:hypothetical protein